MKKTSKILAVLMAVALIMARAIPAFAAETGSITINNAVIGQEYTIYKMADLESYDYIYYMDGRNLRYLRQMFPGFDRFLPFLDRDVADPWYSGDFTQTWADIQEGCERILEELRCLIWKK